MELTPPAIAVEAKRARKRSRYLSPPYTDTAIQLVDDDGEEEEPPPDVSAADVLLALRAAARGLSPDPDAAQALHFLALYRRTKTFVHSAAAGVGHRSLLNLPASTTTCPAPALPTPTPAPGSSKKKQKQRMRKNKKMMNDGAGGVEHFRNPRLQDLPPTPMTINVPLPVPKLPLKDVRNNLEKMILSLNHRSSSSFKAGSREEGKPAAMGNLVGEMQGLLAKVDKMLHGGASSGVHHH